MNKFFKIILFSITLILARDSPFRSFDIVIYPEYYYDGVMVEIESRIKEGQQPFELTMALPSNIDSVFYVQKNELNRGNVRFLDIQNKKSDPLVRLKIEDSDFKMFLFYKLKKEGEKRKGAYILNINYDIDEAHIVIQEPLSANEFKISEKISDIFSDENGINYNRMHINNLKKNSPKEISFDYTNELNELTINLINNQSMLPSDALSEESNTKTRPIRYSVPVWQPISVLIILAFGIGFTFFLHLKKEKISNSASLNSKKNKLENFCIHCGKPVGKQNKFCANCGGKL